MAAQFQFNAGDLKKLLDGASDSDNVIIGVEYEVLDAAAKIFKATVSARLSGKTITGGDPGQTAGCPIPPGCP